MASQSLVDLERAYIGAQSNQSVNDALQIFYQTNTVPSSAAQAKAGQSLSKAMAGGYDTPSLGLTIGDSISRGSGASNNGTDSFFDRWNQEAAAVYTGQAPGKGFKPVFADDTPYGIKTWSAKTNGVADPCGIEKGGWILNTNTHTISDVEVFDAVDVFITEMQTGGATYQINVDGVSVATGNSTNGALGAGTQRSGKRIRISNLRLGKHTLAVVQTSAGVLRIDGYIPHIGTTAKGMVVANGGIGHTTLASWAQSAAVNSTALDFLNNNTVDIVFIMAGLNDQLGIVDNSIQPSANAQAAATNLTTLVNLIRATTGGALATIVVMAEYFAGTVAVPSTITFTKWTNEWVPAMAGVAIAKNCMFADLNAALGDCSVNGPNVGLTIDSGLHLGVKGQQMIANTISSWLISSRRRVAFQTQRDSGAINVNTVARLSALTQPFTLPANVLGAGDVLNLRGLLRMGAFGAASTFRWEVICAGITVLDWTTPSLPNSVNATTADLDIVITLDVAGAGGKAVAAGHLLLSGDGVSALNAVPGAVSGLNVPPTGFAFNTTTAQTVDIFCTAGTLNAGVGGGAVTMSLIGQTNGI